MPRNPPWEREELILALDLYHRVGVKGASPTNPEVIRISGLLRSLPLHAERTREDFRNPNSVVLKLMNFAHLDEKYGGKGLSAIGAGDIETWNEFRGRETELTRLAALVWEAPPTLGSSVLDTYEANEGRLLSRIHLARERDPRLVAKKKELVRRETGRLACEACGFDFARRYGPPGEGYIECHHLVPLSSLAGERTTRVEDLSLLCANCHRVVHRSRPWLSFDGLRATLRDPGLG